MQMCHFYRVRNRKSSISKEMKEFFIELLISNFIYNWFLSNLSAIFLMFRLKFVHKNFSKSAE